MRTQRRFSFSREQRMRRKAQIQAALARGRITRTEQLRLYTLSNDSGPRLGVIVSRRVLPRAVDRNRFKRIAREAFRRLRNELRPMDYLLRAYDGMQVEGGKTQVVKALDRWRDPSLKGKA